MFEGTSKGRLVGWSLFWAAFFFLCWTTDTLFTRLLATVFLIVAVALIAAAVQKFKRDAGYHKLGSHTATLVEPPDPSPTSRRFGPPPSTYVQ